jgi:hypothetical protein
MAKIKDRAISPQQSAPSENATESKPASEQLPLLDEVQAFLSQRAELLKKVTVEIAATEKKLAELKQTAAMLSGNGKVATNSERKPRKAKAKSDSNDAVAVDAPPPTEAQG